MSFEEEFDKIIRQKAGDAEFPFDEKNWEKARKMLDNERKAVGFGATAKFSVAVVLLVTLLTAGYFIYSGFEESGSIQASITVTKTNGTENSKVSVAKNSTLSEAFNPTTPVTNPVSEISNARSNESSASDESVSATINDVVSKKSDLPATEKESEFSNRIIATKTEKTKYNTTTSSQVSAVVPASKEDVEDREKVKNASNTTDNSNLNKDIIKNNSSSVSKTENNNNTVGSTALIPSLSSSEEVSRKEAISGNQVHAYEALTQRVPKWENAFTDPEIATAPINTLNYYDDYYTPEKYKNHYLNAEAGGNYLFGWATKKGRDGQGLNWFGGANYGYYITKKLDVSAGLQVYNISHVNQAFFNNSKTEFDFSSLTTQTVITTNAFYYASIPLKVSYALNSQNRIGINCNIGLLMTSQNTVDTYLYKSDVRTDKSTVKTIGYYEGMNTTNIQLGVFYKSKLGKRLYLNGEATFTPSNIYKYTKTDLNTANTLGLRVSLQYTLFEK